MTSTMVPPPHWGPSSFKLSTTDIITMLSILIVTMAIIALILHKVNSCRSKKIEDESSDGHNSHSDILNRLRKCEYKYPDVEFFIPELPVVYQQDLEAEQHGDVHLAMATAATSGSDQDKLCDLPGSPAFPPKRLLSQRRKSISTGMHRLMPTALASELDLSIYTTGEEQELHGMHTVHARGRLHLSVVCDAENCCVIVNVLCAASLRMPLHKPVPAGSDSGGRETDDTCLRVYLTDDKRDCEGPVSVSKVFPVSRRDNADTEYDVSFCLGTETEALQCAPEELSLVVVVCGCDRYSRMEEVGRVMLTMEEVDRHAGTRCMLDMWRDIIPQNTEMPPQGKLFVSLCYKPFRNSIFVVVLKARGLFYTETPPIFPDMDYTPGIFYVQMMMLVSGSVMNRRRSSTRLHCAGPAFNDEYILDVTSCNVDDVTLLFTVFSRDAHGQRTMLGKMNVGPVTYATGSGLDQWTAMTKKPEEVVTQWHTLL